MTAREPPTLERHDFVTLRPDWRSFCAEINEQNAAQHFFHAAQHIEAWRQAERPFVVASRQHGDAPQTLRLGLAGPGKTRLGFRVEVEAIATHARPPRLADIMASLPPDWLGLLARLEAIAAAHSLTLRVYGSAAWQALTALPYLTPASDLDLLIEPSGGKNLPCADLPCADLPCADLPCADLPYADLPYADLPCALAALAAIEGPPRLDGEIRFAGRGDVNWREWLSVLPQGEAARVLVRTRLGPSLVGPNLVDPSLVDPSLVDSRLITRAEVA